MIPKCHELKMARGYVLVWEPLLLPVNEVTFHTVLDFALVVLLYDSNFASMASSLLIGIWICKQIGKH